MKNVFGKALATLLISALILMTFTISKTYAESGLRLEIDHEWFTDNHTYANAVTAGDLDRDGITEIVTVGYFFNKTHPISPYQGEADIWNWNGTQMTLENAEYFEVEYLVSNDSQFHAVALGNVDNNTDTEVVIVGYGTVFSVQKQGLLVVGSWNGSTFERKTTTYWPFVNQETQFLDVALGDVDSDGVTEIVAVGYRNKGTLNGVMTVWNVTGTNLILEDSQEWIISGDTTANAVTMDDVDLDGALEIFVTGDFYDNDLSLQQAMLRIREWDASLGAYVWKVSHSWDPGRDTYSKDIATGDLNSDGIPEIVTLGTKSAPETTNSQVNIWSWKDEILTPRLSVEDGIVMPFAFTDGRAVTVNDVDSDGTNEIVAIVDVSYFFSSTPQIKVLSWDGGVLVAKDSKDWTQASLGQDVFVDDVDDDNEVEILTAGYYRSPFIGPPPIPPNKAELGIWSPSKVASSITIKIWPKNIVIGGQVKISGMVANEADGMPIPNVEVTIKGNYEDTALIMEIGTVKTNEYGGYSLLWIPPSPGNCTIEASWKGDFEHAGANVTTTLGVKKAFSVIALTLSSYAAEVGDTIIVDGTLYPAKSTAIIIEYMMPNGGTTTENVNSNDAGVFSDTFTADSVGEWTICASWVGDDAHEGTENSPVTLTVAKHQSTLWIEASPLTVNAGENVTISGELTGTVSQTIINLVYTTPNGTKLTKTVASTSTGMFTHAMKLDQAGIWQIKATWNGNTQYEAADSNPMAVTAQTVDQLTPTLAMAGLGLGLIALIIAALGIYLASKKKTAAPPPPAPTAPAAPPSPPPATPST